MIPGVSKPVVLVVEDDEMTQELLALRLEGLDCEMALATTVEDAVRLARERRPLLALVDIKLRDEVDAGLRVIRELLLTPETATIPVVVHSVFASHPSDLPGELRDVHSIVAKPLQYKKLAAIVAALVSPDEA